MKKQGTFISIPQRFGKIGGASFLATVALVLLQSLQTVQSQPDLTRLWEKPWEASQGYWFSQFADFNSDGRTDFSMVTNDGNYATTGQLSMLINQDLAYNQTGPMAIPPYSDCWTFPHWDNQVTNPGQYFADADGDGAIDYLEF